MDVAFGIDKLNNNIRNPKISKLPLQMRKYYIVSQVLNVKLLDTSSSWYSLMGNDQPSFER